MYREHIDQHLPWTDRTRTAINGRQMDRSEKWLREHSSGGIFTGRDEEAPAIWHNSFDGQLHSDLRYLYTR